MKVFSLLILVMALVPVRSFAQSFVSPIGGIPYQDWTIVNYTDLDAGNGVLDWNSGDYTYDGHDAIDFTLPNFAAMDAGVPVYAAKGGEVSDVHDGEYDRWSRVDPNPGVSANYVSISHTGGVETNYYHLKKDSISVSIGDTVTAGQQIGLVGSSGNSSDAHLHFSVYQNYSLIETYQNSNYWWQSPLIYAGEVAGALDSGIVDHQPTLTELVDRPVDVNVYNLQDGAAQQVFSWSNLHGISQDSTLEYFFLEPDGNQFAHLVWTTNQIRYGWWTAAIELPSNAKLGTWTIEAKVNGVTFLEDTFTVVDSASPEAATLISPTGTTAETTPAYIWNAVSGATWYYLWVNDVTGTPVKQWFTASAAGCASGSGTCSITPAISISGNAFWWVQTWNNSGYGPWSAYKTFDTNNGSEPSQVLLIAPTGTGAGGNPTYSWQQVTGATWYYLWVNDTSGTPVKEWFRVGGGTLNCSAGICSASPSSSISGNATWWVRGWNTYGSGLWSAPEFFAP